MYEKREMTNSKLNVKSHKRENGLNHYSLNKFKTILVTGGCGFIGSTLIRRLLIDTDAQIINIDKMGYASDLTSIQSKLEEIGEKGMNRHKLIQLDLKDKDKVADVFSSFNPDIVFHLAAESHVDRSIESPEIFISSNIVGTFNLLEAARNQFASMKGLRSEGFRFVHISTDEVFGSLGSDGYFSETSSYDPRSPYSASKAASDHLARAWFHTYDLPIIMTNCSNNYGPWQFPEKLIPVVIRNAISGSSIPIYGDGQNIRDWLYVEDHIDGMLIAACRGQLGKSYCIGGNNERSNLEIAKEICEILDRLIPNKHHHQLIKLVNDRPGHDRRYAIDSSLIQNELKWSPSTSFSEGLEHTIRWYLKNASWLDKSIVN